MTDVDWWMGLMVVGDQRAFDRGAELPVAPDPGGQGQQPLGDPDPDALDGVGAVAFQAELVFEGVEDGLDPLADPAQVAEPGRLISPVGADQPHLQLRDQLREGPAGEALVAQDDHAWAQDALAGGPVQQGFGDLALTLSGVGQAPGHRHPVRAGQHIQLEPPVPAAVAGVIAIAGPAGQRRTLAGLAALAAGDRGSVQQPPLVTPGRTGHRHRVQDGNDQWRGPTQAAVVGRLAADIGEQVPQPATDGPKPAPLGVIAEQDLGDRQTDQLGVRQPRRPARPAAGFQQLVDGDIECDDEVVETGVHEASLEVDVAEATPTLGGLVTVFISRRPRPNSASVIEGDSAGPPR